MTRLRVTRKSFKFTTLDGTRYMIPDFAGQPELVFNRLEISVDDNGEDVIGTSGEKRTLKRLGDIVCYHVDTVPRAKHVNSEQEVIVALYREGVNKPTAVERVNDVEHLWGWHLLWDNVQRSVIVPGRHFLLVANLRPAADIAEQFERLEDCYIYRFSINEVKRN